MQHLFLINYCHFFHHFSKQATNLAGIARTCEIFCVERLTVADLAICKSESFQSIAVSSEEWLPMSQVHSNI